MATPRILPEPRRNCEQSLAFRATVSPPHLGRRLPRPALAPIAPLRLVQQALDAKNPIELARALTQLSQQKAAQQTGHAHPLPHPAA